MNEVETQQGACPLCGMELIQVQGAGTKTRSNGMTLARAWVCINAHVIMEGTVRVT